MYTYPHISGRNLVEVPDTEPSTKNASGSGASMSVAELTQFVPSSASHIYYQNKHIINTRYVNYLLLEDGMYYFSNPKNHIITKNIMSILDNDTMTPKSFELMNDDSIDLENTVYPIESPCNIFGLEDIRLYEHENKIRFIATNRNFAPMYTNCIVIGDYNINSHSYDNCKLINSPKNATYEKNWIPLIADSRELFIYNWCPMEIYRLNASNDNIELAIQHQNTINIPNFHRVRGSSVFIDVGDYLLGVVHFSEESKPRQYYHMLVSLEKTTFKPLRYSETFHFQHIGIEFCIGFWKDKQEYIFWVSKTDRNACMMKIDVDKLPLRFEFPKI